MSTELVLAAVDCSGRLRSGETLGGTPTVTPSSAGLTITSVAVTAAAWTINGSTVAIGQAVTFLVTGGTEGKTYDLEMFTTTSNGQDLGGRFKLKVEG